MRKALPLFISVTLLFAACGSDGDAETSDAPTTTAALQDETPATTEATETTEAVPETTAAVEDSPETTEATEDEPDGVEGSNEFELTEWALDGPTELTAGSISFTATNGGSFGHEFAIAVGDSYDTLPLQDNGAVDEVALGDDFLGRTDLIDGGGSADISFDLEAGNYVLFCNIAVGPNSHAALGQTLSVTVS